MKEATIRTKVKKEMLKQGWIGCTISSSRFGSCVTTTETESLRGDDVFTIWDGIFWRGNKLRFLQWTTTPNRSSHRKKIKKFFKDNDVYQRTELWCYDTKKKLFVIEKI